MSYKHTGPYITGESVPAGVGHQWRIAFGGHVWHSVPDAGANTRIVYGCQHNAARCGATPRNGYYTDGYHERQPTRYSPICERCRQAIKKGGQDDEADRGGGAVPPVGAVAGLGEPDP